MKFKIRYKFYDGSWFETGEFEPDNITGDGDVFRLILNGKMDGRQITINTESENPTILNYLDVSSVEIIFIEDRY